ncbi:MAG: hypothetical protein ABIQ00_24765 [Chitinophagaceae bacterium]
MKRALPTARIGGLNITGTSSTGATQWMNTFYQTLPVRHQLRYR